MFYFRLLQKVTYEIYLPPVNIKSEALNTFFVLKKLLSIEIYYNRIYSFRIKIYNDLTILETHTTAFWDFCIGH